MLKMRVIEGLRKTVVPCPKRYKGRKPIATIVDINCQVIKKRIDQKVKVFCFFCQTKAKPNKARADEVGVRQQEALILEVNEAGAKSLWPDIKAFGDQ